MTTALTESRRDYSGQGEQVGTRSIAPAPYPTHQATTPETPVADLPPPLRVSDPMTFLTAFDYGRVSQLPDGRVRREYTVIALDREVEVAPATEHRGEIKTAVSYRLSALDCSGRLLTADCLLR